MTRRQFFRILIASWSFLDWEQWNCATDRTDPETGQPTRFRRFADLQMLLVTGGQKRNEAEYRALLGEAGFSPTRVIPNAFKKFLLEKWRRGQPQPYLKVHCRRNIPIAPSRSYDSLLAQTRPRQHNRN
jgi:O-methyltransferase domain